ncbi:MAG: hypothetical protein BJ554DRAFT_1212 [Olpidium bornovanus]|uniref:Retrovirus-related Pol polyprotein from transposon TNT 1-94 n=1 Tax=Olpidium bornovanus TaxID=278681 RepID=A0A8H8DHY9_9FUNG|nr:MAG: hypothetical protein BJ554DRAFT_1212 [Olpidium bornovanus]
MGTHSGIEFVVGFLGRQQSDPRQANWDTEMRALQYQQTTADRALTLRETGLISPLAVPATAPTRGLLVELGEGESVTPTVDDSRGTRALAKNSVHHQRSNHIDVRWHFVRNIVSRGLLTLADGRTVDMVSDAFTNFSIKCVPRNARVRRVWFVALATAHAPLGVPSFPQRETSAFRAAAAAAAAQTSSSVLVAAAPALHVRVRVVCLAGVPEKRPLPATDKTLEGRKEAGKAGKLLTGGKLPAVQSGLPPRASALSDGVARQETPQSAALEYGPAPYGASAHVSPAGRSSDQLGCLRLGDGESPRPSTASMSRQGPYLLGDDSSCDDVSFAAGRYREVRVASAFCVRLFGRADHGSRRCFRVPQSYLVTSRSR